MQYLLHFYPHNFKITINPFTGALNPFTGVLNPFIRAL